ncbi:hypothetical protein [Schumannella luteola]
MPRALSAASVGLLAALALAACTSPAPEPTPTSSSTSTSAPAAGGRLPSCDDVGLAVADLAAGLSYDEARSAGQTAQEAYDQRVCVFVSPDGGTQLGVTIAAIPILQEELDLYGTLPGVIADERTSDGSAVLQALDADDSADGHLDSALYLFDTVHSITIQGHSDAGALATELPGLTVPAATEAAFAVRGLL